MRSSDSRINMQETEWQLHQTQQQHAISRAAAAAQCEVAADWEAYAMQLQQDLVAHDAAANLLRERADLEMHSCRAALQHAATHCNTLVPLLRDVRAELEEMCLAAAAATESLEKLEKDLAVLKMTKEAEVEAVRSEAAAAGRCIYIYSEKSARY